jgi:hypothetical protein
MTSLSGSTIVDPRHPVWSGGHITTELISLSRRNYGNDDNDTGTGRGERVRVGDASCLSRGGTRNGLR